MLRNRARCLKCGDVIESKFRHGFQVCSCRTIFIDGGTDYFRGGGDFAFYVRVLDDDSEEPIDCRDQHKE